MMNARQLSAFVRLPYKNLINNLPPLISTPSNFSGQKPEKSLKPKRKVGKTMSINLATNTNNIWKIIRKISGKPQSTTLRHLRKDQTEATTKKDTAEMLAKTFSQNFSLNTSNPQFITYKNLVEKQKLNFKTNNSEKYNLPFTPAELKEAIKASHNTAVGPNEIHYEFLKHLPNKSLTYLQNI